jgi:hypothetical protein
LLQSANFEDVAFRGFWSREDELTDFEMLLR